MSLIHLLFFGVLAVLAGFVFAAALICRKEKKKNSTITGKIIALIDDRETLPVEYAVKKLIDSVQRLESKGMALDIYLVNRSENPETEKLLTILNRQYCRLHIIKNKLNDTKNTQEILHSRGD